MESLVTSELETRGIKMRMILKTLIIKRTEPYPHYEVHKPNSDIVEFWNITLDKKIGESKVEKVE